MITTAAAADWATPSRIDMPYPAVSRVPHQPNARVPFDPLHRVVGRGIVDEDQRVAQAERRDPFDEVVDRCCFVVDRDDDVDGSCPGRWSAGDGHVDHGLRDG